MSIAVIYERVKVVRKLEIEVVAPGFVARDCFL